MKVFDGDEVVDLLWMTRRDLEKNIELWGPQKALNDGLACYRLRKDVRQLELFKKKKERRLI